MKLFLGLIVLFLSFALLSAAARADAVPIEEFVCMGGVLKAGDACTINGAAGTCKDSQCTHYWRDGGTDTYSCLECVLNPPSDSSCTIGKQSAVKRIGPWALAGLFSLLVLFGRRWRRR